MSGIPAVVLPVGADLYAVPIDWIREVVPVPALTELVTAPAFVLGLMNLRGQIVPLLDTAALLRVGTVAPADFAVVLNTPQGLAALATSGLPWRTVLDAAAGPSELRSTAGTYLVGQGIAVLIDPLALLAPEILGGVEQAAPESAGVV